MASTCTQSQATEVASIVLTTTRTQLTAHAKLKLATIWTQISSGFRTATPSRLTTLLATCPTVLLRFGAARWCQSTTKAFPSSTAQTELEVGADVVATTATAAATSPRIV